MIPNRPLLPHEVHVWQQRDRVRENAKRWLQRSLPGRVLLVGLAIKGVATILGVVAPSSLAFFDVVDAIGSLTLILVGGYLLGKGAVWTKRRLLWRVRRKLILSYVFVGLVPGLLIIAFFLMAGLVLFFNVSSFLVESRVRTLGDQARFLAQSAVLEAEHGDSAEVLRRRLGQRLAIAAERFPFASIAIVPVEKVECKNRTAKSTTAPEAMAIGPWQHLDAPAALPRWIRCDGFVGLLLYEVDDGAPRDFRLVMRAVAVPDTPLPRWAAVVDLPFTAAVEDRLREETGVRLGDVSPQEVPGTAPMRIPLGRLLESRPQVDQDQTLALGQEWVTAIDVHEWLSGAPYTSMVAMQLNLPDIYARISTATSARDFGQILLIVLAFIGVLFLTIQFIALVIGFALARQITGAVHDLFTGTEHLRNRDFTYHIPVRARDQLGELAESFNVMTGEITTLIRENAEKARMEQEMLAAREIQQRLLPSGSMTIPGLAVTAFCEPAREVAGDYFDFLQISPTRLGVLIADVSGKGLPAGLYMAQLKVLVQSLARTHQSPAEFLKAVNRVVAANIDSKSFITMSYGVIDLEKKLMTFARAGHCPLIRVPGAAPAGLRKSELVTPDGLVLGLKIDDGAMFDAMINEVTIPLAPGDLVVFFTDGISETMNDAFDCYGEQRLARVLEQYAHLPFEQLRAFIFADLRSFAGAADQHDDMTMVLLKVEEAAEPAQLAAAGFREEERAH
jgi:sigma-B regulation protein RsbU (phosphoserine phosphatase)